MKEKDGKAWAKAQEEGRFVCLMPCTDKCEMYEWCVLDCKIVKVQFT